MELKDWLTLFTRIFFMYRQFMSLQFIIVNKGFTTEVTHIRFLFVVNWEIISFGLCNFLAWKFNVDQTTLLIVVHFKNSLWKQSKSFSFQQNKENLFLAIPTLKKALVQHTDVHLVSCLFRKGKMDLNSISCKLFSNHFKTHIR